jgi:hypothetical protein
MTKFAPVLDSNTDYVNYAHVAIVKPTPDRENFLLYGADGKCLGKPEYDIPIDTIVPAAPGCFAWVVYFLSDDEGLDSRPTSAKATRVMVVAWRIGPDYEAFPITAGLRADNITFVELPSGHLEGVSGSYTTVEDAKAAVLHKAQAAWDSNHAARPTPITPAA